MMEREYVLVVGDFQRSYRSLQKARDAYDLVECVFRKMGQPLPLMMIRSEAIYSGK